MYELFDFDMKPVNIAYVGCIPRCVLCRVGSLELLGVGCHI